MVFTVRYIKFRSPSFRTLSLQHKTIHLNFFLIKTRHTRPTLSSFNIFSTYQIIAFIHSFLFLAEVKSSWENQNHLSGINDTQLKQWNAQAFVCMLPIWNNFIPSQANWMWVIIWHISDNKETKMILFWFDFSSLFLKAPPLPPKEITDVWPGRPKINNKSKLGEFPYQCRSMRTWRIRICRSSHESIT